MFSSNFLEEQPMKKDATYTQKVYAPPQWPQHNYATMQSTETN